MLMPQYNDAFKILSYVMVDFLYIVRISGDGHLMVTLTIVINSTSVHSTCHS